MTETTGHATCITLWYDAEARASYQQMGDQPVAITREHGDGTIRDYASDGTLVGIERLYP